MTMPNERGREKRFVPSTVPWLVGAGALAVYLLTFNNWVSLGNLNQVARNSGWAWGPELYSPLYYLLTYPTRWLPVASVPLALNLFTVVCAVLTLVLLARSVALMPHDRTEAQRQREPRRCGLSLGSAWVPPVLAVVLCGLSLSFWESATTGSSEMLELLTLAYVIRCLLEYRVARRDSWMLRAALVCGLAMANGWLMFCLFPGFLIAVLWIKGLKFFEVRFLFKMFVCGVAGMLLYLVLPLVYVLSPDPMGSFWQALKLNLSADRSMFMFFVTAVPTNVRLLLALTSFLPILVIGIRWASNFGDPSRMGGLLANWVFHLAHGALLGVCVWTAFDPDFSPRHKGFPFIALYYLGALSVGYLSGYFLLVFKPIPDHMGRTTASQEWLHRLSRAVVWMLLVLVPAGLVGKNLARIRMTNGPALKEYASLLVQKLPESAVLLCDPDDQRSPARKLFLAEAWLTRQGKAKNYFFVETLLLKVPSYHAAQQKRRPGEWPLVVNVKSTDQVDDPSRIRLLLTLAEAKPMYYLHPSFGSFFEYFYQEPRGLSLVMKPCTTNFLAGPPLGDAETADNEKFWSENESVMRRLIPFIAPPPPGAKPGLKERLLQRLHISFEPNTTAVLLGAYYSQALDYWGVRLQRAGKLVEAEKHFQTALALHSENIAAKANLALNRELQAGRRPAFRIPAMLAEELGKYRNLQEALRITGPFDDPVQSYGQAVVFATGGNVRQAAQQFERIHELVPDNPTVQMLLAKLYIQTRLPEKALDLLNNFDNRPGVLTAAGVSPLDVLFLKAMALYVARKEFEGDQLLQDAMRNKPADTNLLSGVLQLSAMAERYTNALTAIELQLRLNPDDPAALISKGLCSMKLGHFQDAIQPLTRALEVQTNNFNAQLFRAVSYLNCERLEEARQDYECLLKSFPKAIDVNGGLGEIALRQGDTNAAIRYFEVALAEASPGSDQARVINDRIQNLKRPPVPSTNAPPPGDKKP